MRIRLQNIATTLVTGVLVTLVGCSGSSSNPGANPVAPANPSVHVLTAPRTIIMVWDGLRPDSINATDTPNLYNLKQTGVFFADNHSVYPTFTMMNGQSFASGSWPGVATNNSFQSSGSGFYGNTFWAAPSDTSLTAGTEDANSSTYVGAAVAATGAGTTLFVEPVFTEDHQILDELNAYYQNQGESGLLLVQSLFQAAQAAGFKTATIGKSGAAFIQDFTQASSTGRVFLDENSVRPAALVRDLISAKYPLPINVVNDPEYAGPNDPTGSAGGLATYVGQQGIAPTYFGGASTLQTKLFNDAVTCSACSLSANDPSDQTQGVAEGMSNEYMMHVFKDFVLPNASYRPDLALIWFRTPDNPEHSYGPGSANAIAGLRSQDARLGELITALRDNGLETTTNIIVVSDHGHSSVSGPVTTFPLLTMTQDAVTPVAYSYGPNGAAYAGSTSNTGAAIGATTTNTASFRGTVMSNAPATFGTVSSAPAGGYSFSGDVRIADLLYYRGLNAYDGAGCSKSFMAGLVNGTTPVLTLKKEAAAGQFCSPVVGAPEGSAATYMAISAPAVPPLQVAGTNLPRANFAIKSKSASYATNFVMSTNQGGSDFVYVPSHNGATVAAIVTALQQRQEIGAIFVDSSYLPGGANAPAVALSGVMPMSAVNLENAARKGAGQPDLIVSFNWDGTIVSTTSTVDKGTVTHVGQIVQGMAGTTFESQAARHGMHGSFGTTDVHNTLIANGPSFKTGYVDVYPSGNVDVAPTVAAILGTTMPQAQGRILVEALTAPPYAATLSVSSSVKDPSAFGVAATASGLRHESLTDQTGVLPASTAYGDPVTLSAGTYSINLAVKDLVITGPNGSIGTYRYFDYAQPVRQ